MQHEERNGTGVAQAQATIEELWYLYWNKTGTHEILGKRDYNHTPIQA
jgi:hypothetical protein